jgi:hypothetical protein
MTHQCNRLARAVERLEQFGRHRALSHGRYCPKRRATIPWCNGCDSTLMA